MCNSIIITSSEMRGTRALRSHRPAKLNGHLRANLWWTGRDPSREREQHLVWHDKGRGGNLPGLYNPIMNQYWILQSYCGSLQSLHSHLNTELNLVWGGSIIYLGTFYRQPPLIVFPLSWQRVNTWNWAAWTLEGDLECWAPGRFSLLPVLIIHNRVKRLFLLWSSLAHKGDTLLTSDNTIEQKKCPVCVRNL